MKGKIDGTKVPGYKPPVDRCCKWCGTPMKPYYEFEELSDDATGENVVKIYTKKYRPIRVLGYGYGGEGGEGIFCTLRCGYLMGRNAVLSGS